MNYTTLDQCFSYQGTSLLLLLLQEHELHYPATFFFFFYKLCGSETVCFLAHLVQCHPAKVEADTKCCDEAFASSISSLMGSCTHCPNDDKKKTLDQPKSARKMDEWPTFDLGF